MEGDLTPRPTVRTPDAKTMDFPDALREINKRKRIRSLAWPSNDYGMRIDGWLKVFTKGKLHVWKVNDGDLDATDFVVI